MARPVYLYCVVGSTRRPGALRVPPGVPLGSRPAVEPLADGLWLVTAFVPLEQYGPAALERSLQDIEWVGGIALAHQAVVEHFAARPGVTVVPMQLFTMFSSVARARATLERQVDTLTGIFARIEGCEEWGVRVTSGTPAGPRPRRAPRTGTGFLAARKEARDAARSRADAVRQAADLAFDDLAAHAREHHRRAPDVSAAGMLLDAAFLVPARRRARFHAAVERAAGSVARTGGRMTLTGPWPPYTFVREEAR